MFSLHPDLLSFICACIVCHIHSSLFTTYKTILETHSTAVLTTAIINNRWDVQDGATDVHTDAVRTRNPSQQVEPLRRHTDAASSLLQHG